MMRLRIPPREAALAGALALAALILTACDAKSQRALKALGSEAEPVVVHHDIDQDGYIVNGVLDYGCQVNCRVQNSGPRGMVLVRVFLSCSEGEWSIDQTRTMGRGETGDFHFLFTQPTINATGIRYELSTVP